MISCKAVIKDIDIKIIPSTLSSNFFELSFRGIRLSLFRFFFLRIFFEPVQPCFRVLMTVHCISVNFYVGENDFLLWGDTCHGLTNTRVPWRNAQPDHERRDLSQRSYPVQHLSRDVDVLRANQGWLDAFLFFASNRHLEIAIDSIRSRGDNDSSRMDR